jgi:hypothetical protein
MTQFVYEVAERGYCISEPCADIIAALDRARSVWGHDAILSIRPARPDEQTA